MKKNFPPAKFSIPATGRNTPLPLNVICKILPVVTYEENFDEYS